MSRGQKRRSGWISSLIGIVALCFVAGGAIFVGLGASGSSVWAQEPPQAEEPGDKAQIEKRRKTLERIQALRHWKLEETLDVEEGTLEKVDAELRRYDERLFARQIELEMTGRKLKRAVRRGAKDQRYESLIARTLELKAEVDKLRIDQYKAAAKHLPPEQKARLLLFIPEFDRKVKQVMKKRANRKNRRRGDGDGPDRPPRRRGEF